MNRLILIASIIDSNTLYSFRGQIKGYEGRILLFIDLFLSKKKNDIFRGKDLSKGLYIFPIFSRLPRT